MVLSSTVFADTYPASVVDNMAACVAYAPNVGGVSCVSMGLNPDQWSGEKFQILNSGGTWISTIYLFVQYECLNGGSLSGTSCINAPPCTDPNVRNATTGACETPAVTCTAGQTKTLLIVAGTYPPAGTPPTVVLNQDRTATAIAPVTVSQGGCGYDLPLNPKQNTGCFSSSTGIMYCRVQATQNGSYISGSDTALDGALTTDKTPVPSANPGCILTQTGEEICATSTAKNCGTVNGTSICVKDGALTSAGYPVSIVDGQVVAGTTNVNGQVERCAPGTSGVKCVNLPVVTCGPGTFFTCLQPQPTASQPTPQPIPITSDPKTVVKHQNTSNPDGSRTVTTTGTQDIVGQVPSVTIQNYDPSGVLTQTTSTGPALGSGSSPGIGSGLGDSTNNVDIGNPGTGSITADTSGMDGIFTGATSALSSGITNSNFLPAPVTPPTPSTCQTVPMNYKKLQYTFDPCSKLATFREMFGYLLYVLTAFAIYEIATRRPA